MTCTNIFTMSKTINEMIANVVSFHPPTPTYNVSISDKCFKDNLNNRHIKCYNTLKFSLNNNIQIDKLYPWIRLKCYGVTKKCTNKNIVLIKLENKSTENFPDDPKFQYSNKSLNHNACNSPLSVLVSHGNATDLGLFLPVLVDMCTQWKVFSFI